MSEIDLQKFPSAEALADTAAADWIAAVQLAENEGRPLSVALSGGRIARNFFEATARLAHAQRAGFGHVKFFWADERCVPADHDDSNFKLAKAHLLDPLGIRTERIHSLAGDEDGRSKAMLMADELKRLVPLNREGIPSLDIIFLGMGEDAHVASLFPEESDASRNLSDLFRPVIATKPPPQRITMGYPVLAAAHQVWVLASGAGKAGALADSMKEGSNTPLGRVLQSRKRTRIYSDV